MLLNVIRVTNTAMPEKNSKGAGKAFPVKIENKMLLQTIRIL